MRSAVLLFLFSAALVAGDADFNGRWNITVIKEPRGRAWWLEVEGAGGKGALKGRFVGAPGGNMDPITDLAIHDGELRFTFNRKEVLTYRARLVNGHLEGAVDSPSLKRIWTGKRAPVIRDQDDGSWREGKPVSLFNGKDLTGWKPQVPGKPLGWSVTNGILGNVADANNLISERKFWNFSLHAEYRLQPHSNSGIGLRARYEVQILDDYGQPPDTHGHGAIYSRIPPAKNASKPAGAWQTMDVRLVGRTVTVVLNDVKVIDKQQIEGFSAVVVDPNEAQAGPLILQGDHRPVEFRKLVVTPLVR